MSNFDTDASINDDDEVTSSSIISMKSSSSYSVPKHNHKLEIKYKGLRRGGADQ